MGDRGGHAEVGDRPAPRPHRHHRGVAERDDADQAPVVDDRHMTDPVPRHELAGLVLVGGRRKRVEVGGHAPADWCRRRVLSVDDELHDVALGEDPNGSAAIGYDDRRGLVLVELAGGLRHGVVGLRRSPAGGTSRQRSPSCLLVAGGKKCGDEVLAQ